MIYTVYIQKHVSKLVMRYGQYNSRDEAVKALQHVQSVNTVDAVYIEEMPDSPAVKNSIAKYR